jgi:NADH dehydrogenase
VGEYLRSVSHPGVYVVGDAAAVTLPGIGRLRKTCAAARPMGWYVGRALARGGASKPYTYRYVVQCVSLDRGSGMLRVVEKDDAMTRCVYGGRTGRLIKAAIVRYVVLGLRWRRARGPKQGLSARSADRG